MMFSLLVLGFVAVTFAAPNGLGVPSVTMPVTYNGVLNLTAPLPYNDSIPPQKDFEEFVNSLNETQRKKYNISIQADSRASHSVSAPTNSDCTVREVPNHVRRRLGLDNYFYQKYAHAYGIPVLASNRVQPKAIERACYVMRFLFADRADIRDWFYQRRGRAGIMAIDEGTTTIPEHRFLPAWWNQRARGLGATIQVPISTGGEENLLCLKNDRYQREDIFLHEFVHGIHNLGATGAIPTFDYRLKIAYQNARRAGRWYRTYAMSTDREYFSEGVQSFFHVNDYASPPNGIHNDINTREKLKKYDPALYNLVKEVFPCENIILDRCDAKDGKKAPSFKENCKNGGGTVVTDKPPQPGQCVDNNNHCSYWATTGECKKKPTYMLVNCCKSCKKIAVTSAPPKPDTPPPPKPDTPPPPLTKPVTPPKPNTAPPPTQPVTPPKPNTPPPSTQPVTPPKPNTAPPPTQPVTPPKPNTAPPPTQPVTPPKPNTAPPPTQPVTPPKPNTAPPPTQPVTPPKPNTPPPPTQPVTPPKPNTLKPNCRDNNTWCSHWANRGECSKNPHYMKSSCCWSCSGCFDKNVFCSSWARRGECKRNPSYMLPNCCKSCNV